MVAEVVEPFITVGLLLLGACLVAAQTVREGLWAQALIGAGLFSGLFLLREWLPGRVPLVAELRTIVALIRARRRGVAPGGAAP
jgi:PST family polysaccharide transporter